MFVVLFVLRDLHILENLFSRPILTRICPFAGHCELWFLTNQIAHFLQLLIVTWVVPCTVRFPLTHDRRVSTAEIVSNLSP